MTMSLMSPPRAFSELIGDVEWHDRVRLTPKGDVVTALIYVRFAPESGHRLSALRCLPRDRLLSI